MPRPTRVVIPNCPHHVTQRGNNRRDVFFDDEDRRIYLKLLREHALQHEVDVWGYCLMTNHVHILATPSTPESLSKMFGRTHNDYSRWQNIRRQECGHLWQNRFYSCPVEASYLWAVLAYIERNPVRAGMVNRCQDWAWSSARNHLMLGGEPSTWLRRTEWAQNWTADAWEVALEQGLAEADLRLRLAEATKTGVPLGGEGFITACEAHTQRDLHRKQPKNKPTSGTDSEALAAAVGPN